MNEKIKITMMAAIVMLTLLLLLMAAPRETMPVPEYPLSAEQVSETMKQYGFSESLYLEVLDITDYPGGESSSYTIRDPDKVVYAGNCFNFLTHRVGAHRSIGGSFNTIDQEEVFSEEEFKNALQLTTALFGGFTDDMQVYEKCRKKYDLSEHFIWEDTLEGIDCQVIYTPESMRKLRVLFATDIDLVAHLEKG